MTKVTRSNAALLVELKNNKSVLIDGDDENFRLLEKLVIKEQESEDPVKFQVICQRIWTFWDSVYFSATVVTTIGYGQIAPSTRSGRIACIIYAIIGICLFVAFSIACVAQFRRIWDLSKRKFGSEPAMTFTLGTVYFVGYILIFVREI